VSVDNKQAIGGISSISELHDHENCGSSGEENMRAHMTLHLCWVLLSPLLPMKVLHCFMGTPLASIMNRTVWTWDWCSFIWNMRFELNNCLKFLWKEERFSHRYSSNILFIIFGGPGEKCIILILCFFRVFLTHLMLSFNCHFLVSFSVSSEMMDRGFSAFHTLIHASYTFFYFDKKTHTIHFHSILATYLKLSLPCSSWIARIWRKQYVQ
jgi:hypothetical protein